MAQSEQHNPVTYSLIQQLDDPALAKFAAYWDALEALVIRVYREKRATPEDEFEFQALRKWLKPAYVRWRESLQPYWSRTRVGGATAQEDPFARLMWAQGAGAFIGDWSGMQNVPAAREALNGFLLDLLDEKKPPPA